MNIGIPKEIKDQEFRTALTVEAVRVLCTDGHRVCLEQGAGEGSGFADEDYSRAGAELVSVGAAWDQDLVLKVKEPQPSEYDRLRNQILFTYLHLAGANPSLTDTLLARGTTAVAYETVRDSLGHLPLLAPMSAVAGNMAITVGGYFLGRFNGGRGVQLGRVLGSGHGRVLVVGDGVVGQHAASVALAMGATVHMASLFPDRVSRLREQTGPGLEVLASTPENLCSEMADTDLLVSAVLRPGARTPHVVTEAMVRRMPKGSVIVDVSIDQGGGVETSHPTSHDAPVFIRHGVVHYCVTNMPGAYPRTATVALSEATLPYIRRLAVGGLAELVADAGFAAGVNVFGGRIRCRPVAEALDRLDDYAPLEDMDT